MIAAAASFALSSPLTTAPATGGAWAPWAVAAVGLVTLAVGLGLGFWLGAAGARPKLAALGERLRLYEAERGRAAQAEEDNQRLRQALAEARARRQLDAERVEWLEGAEEKLRSSFESLARDVFVGVVREGGGDVTARSQAALEKVVQPLRLTLAHLDAQVREVEQNRQGAYQGLRRELQLLRDAQRELHHSTRDLRQALKTSSGSRGRWGELQLR
ncbi:MAG: DNA recombination protein RmuC, partial [Acidobacteriota bacterium]